MNLWSEIKTWKQEQFTRYEVAWIRYVSPDGHTTVEAAASSSIGYGASIGDGASIGYGASIGKDELWMCIGPLGSEGRTLTIVRGKNGVSCYTGCFAGTDAEFLAAVAKKHGDRPLGVGYKKALEFAKAQFASKTGKEAQ